MNVRSGACSGPSDIRRRIAAAQGLLPEVRSALGEDAGLRELLETVRERAEASRAALFSSGVAAECRRCEEEEGGSCCGAGIEDRYSVVILVINLLLGGRLPEERRFETSCHFLGETGCALFVRDTLCVNYLCGAVQKKLAHGDLITLQTIAGEEMDAAFRLHERIGKLLSR